jgi:hypothetical protein
MDDGTGGVLMKSKITIQIENVSRTFVMYEWEAPGTHEVDRAYDGFGTIRIGAYMILIPEEAEDWQTTRYASGLAPVKPMDEGTARQMKHRAVNVLWTLIYGGAQ